MAHTVNPTIMLRGKSPSSAMSERAEQSKIAFERCLACPTLPPDKRARLQDWLAARGFDLNYLEDYAAGRCGLPSRGEGPCISGLPKQQQGTRPSGLLLQWGTSSRGRV